jgi:hypothetical protein
VVQVVWGQEKSATFTAMQSPLRIGIEEFEGKESSVAAQLANYLTANPRLSITDPTNLEIIKKKIAEEKELLADNPEAQIEIRSLGVDVIITGRIEGP